MREALLHRAVADAHAVAPGLPVETRWVEGPAVRALIRRSRQASMTVLGDGDLAAHTCLPRDAVTVQVAARATGTVLVTRAAPPAAGPVVVGVNGSPSSHCALRFAVDAASRYGTELLVVRARERDDETITDLSREVVALVERLAAPRRHAVGIRMVDGSPEEALLNLAAEAALTVVGARGNRPYTGLLGWVAQTVLHHSPTPVVLVRGVPAATGPESPPLRWSGGLHPTSSV
jgi:nucleotide-binding universal stress UspA family protein